jgi:hypothetical protein
LVDVINPAALPEGSALRYTLGMRGMLSRLKERPQKAGLATIYLNDNFGRWRSEVRGQVDVCLAFESRGRKMVKELQPNKRDYFVLKPKALGTLRQHAANFAALSRRGAAFITRIGDNFCVLFTANDATCATTNYLSRRIACSRTQKQKPARAPADEEASQGGHSAGDEDPIPTGPHADWNTPGTTVREALVAVRLSLPTCLLFAERHQNLDHFVRTARQRLNE